MAGGSAWSARGWRSTPTSYFVICVNSLGSCFGSTGPASDRPGHRQALSAELSRPVGRGHRPRRLRDRALAGHRAARRGHRALARRHGRARLRRAVSGRRAAPDQHLRHARPPRRSRSRCARSSAKRSLSDPDWQQAATTPPTSRRAPACASRASSARSPIARPPSGSSASAASRSGADMKRGRSVRVRVRGAGLSRGAGRALRVARSTPTAICTCRAPWIASI